LSGFFLNARPTPFPASPTSLKKLVDSPGSSQQLPGLITLPTPRTSVVAAPKISTPTWHPPTRAAHGVSTTLSAPMPVRSGLLGIGRSGGPRSAGNGSRGASMSLPHTTI